MIGNSKNLSNLIKFINTADILDDYRDDKCEMLKKLSRFYLNIRYELKYVEDELSKAKLVESSDPEVNEIVGSHYTNKLKEVSVLTFKLNNERIEYNLAIWKQNYKDIDISKTMVLLMNFIIKYYNKEGLVLFL